MLRNPSFANCPAVKRRINPETKAAARPADRQRSRVYNLFTHPFSQLSALTRQCDPRVFIVLVGLAVTIFTTVQVELLRFENFAEVMRDSALSKVGAIFRRWKETVSFWPLEWIVQIDTMVLFFGIR